MALANIKGSDFKKMIMKATGTKGYISTSVQRTLQQNKATTLMRDNTKVSRQQATKMIKKLKQAGLAHKVNDNATKYVATQFAKEERRQENIKRQNIADRKAEIAAEKQGAQQAGKKPSTPQKSTYAMPSTGMISTANATVHSDTIVGASFGSTNLKPQNQLPPPPPTKPKEWLEEEQNLIDMVID